MAARAALIALLNSGEQFIMADLYTFTLQGGSIPRYSSAPAALNANGFVFQLGPKIEPSHVRTGHRVRELSDGRLRQEIRLVLWAHPSVGLRSAR